MNDNEPLAQLLEEKAYSLTMQVQADQTGYVRPDPARRTAAAGRRQSEPIFRHPEELPPVWLTRAFRPRTKGRVNHAHCC